MKLVPNTVFMNPNSNTQTMYLKSKWNTDDTDMTDYCPSPRSYRKLLGDTQSHVVATHFPPHRFVTHCQLPFVPHLSHIKAISAKLHSKGIPDSTSSPARLSKKRCIRKMLIMMGRSKKAPATLDRGIIKSSPLSI